MPKKLLHIITISVFALPLVVYSAALANSTHTQSNAALMNGDDGYERCVQTLNEKDFCTARQSSRRLRFVSRESHECTLARGNIARYRQVLPRLDMADAKHRHAASIYRDAHRSEIAWYKQRC